MNPAVPLYEGTRPYQRIPFQWSLHTVDESESTMHQEFLAEGRYDPRRGFAESLIAAAGRSSLPVLVYSSFEGSVLTDLIQLYPDLAGELTALKDRLVDLLPVVREHIYYPSFGASYSIKSVAPALLPSFGYDDLQDVADGMAASIAFENMTSGGQIDPNSVSRLREALRLYCQRDTLALVKLHHSLKCLRENI